MKGLIQFQYFDVNSFFKDKEFTLTGTREWSDYNTGEHQGTKLDVVITRDGTKYRKDKNGADITNLYEKMTIKVPKDISLPIGVKIVPHNAEAKIYGKYHNQLSVTADSVTVAGKEKPNA